MTDAHIAPLIVGDPDAPFWDAWKADETFLLHRCGLCQRHDWPATSCPDHGMQAMEWQAVDAKGVVDTFTIFYRAYTKDMADQVPYTVAVVRMDDGPYFHTRLVHIDPKDVKVGLRVKLRRGAGDDFPLFEPE